MRRFGRLVALAGLLFVAGTTLIPLPRQSAAAAATPLGCLVCGDYGGVDVVLNVLLFVPLALGLRLAGLPTLLVVAVGALTSLTVETLQFAVIPGRDASLSDLVTNTLGSLIGAGVGSRWAVLLNPTARQAQALALTAGVFFLALQAGTAVLLRPWVPREPLRGAWVRPLPGRAPFGGKVVSAAVSGAPVLDAAALDRQIHTDLRRGPTQVEVELVSGQSVPGWAPVFELLGSHGPVLAVVAVGGDLAFQAPARAYALRLRRPGIRLPGALPDSAGRGVRLAAGERRDTLWGAWWTSQSSERRLQALGPSLGWSLLIPFDYAYGSEVHLLTGLWLAGLLLPAGYWAARQARVRPGPALGGLLLAGLGLVPLLGGYPPVHWSEWVAGATGLAAGWATHPAAAYFGGRCDSPSINESC